MAKYQSSTKYEFRQNLKPKIAPLAAAVSGVLAAGALQAATITVDSLDGGHVNDKCTLRSALYSATLNYATANCVAGEAGMDTIVFDSSLSGTIELVDGGTYQDMPTSLRVGESVHIDGDGRITIEGNGSDPVLYNKYDTETLELSGLIITGGSAEYGGGIYSLGKNLTLNFVEVVGNSAGFGGGGVWHAPDSGNGALRITGSLISGNASLGRGAGVGMEITNGANLFPALLVEYSGFSDNAAWGGSGGGLHFSSGDFSRMEIRGSNFSDNESKYIDGGGGGLHADLGYAEALLEGNYFGYNTTTGSGGGLYLTEEKADFHRARIQLTDNGFWDNEAGKRGGGAHLRVESGSYDGNGDPKKWIDNSNSIFGYNLAEEGGGALSIITTGQVPVTLESTPFGFNQVADGRGGAVFAEVEDATLAMLYGGLYRNYIEKGRGGGLFAHVDGGAFYASQFYATGNQNLGSSSSDTGGGMEIHSSNQAKIGMEYGDFWGNSAAGGCGGAVRLQAGPQTDVGVSQSVFFQNYSAACGGGLVARSTGSDDPTMIQLKYSEFTANMAGDSGGAVFARQDNGGTLIVSNTTLAYNSSGGGTGGSALDVFSAGNLQLKYSTVTNNYSASATEPALSFRTPDGCTVTASLFGGNENDANQLRDIGDSGSSCQVSRSLLEGATNSSFDDQGNNLLDIDPMIGPLQVNGGWTRTHALLAGSPAIDAAGVGGLGTPSNDQRGPGFHRQMGPAIDMGAYELQVAEDLIFQDRFEQ